ncbi:hypothetical protein A1O1_00958 [Capronia coronata CBS 617.96]|uniref:RING-type domain-containing protein n=1 Tax=Capronia coronata CBS 617.96 TaxID=1182541 RepID=W9YTK7_9EURO|nr:uncharacterized protein A1O1_00958 [Capronia coronata CBS 617.96]EXJ95833.1 hypothetical protein A1O1_00958 [Capronia coronata CBS 617.96]
MSSPPVSEGYPTTASHDRPDREDLDEDHKYKRRRLEEQPAPSRNMADSSRPPNIAGPPPNLHYAPFYGHPNDAFSFLPPPSPMTSGALWEEDAALQYLASGSGFAQDLRGLVPAFTLPYSFPTAPSTAQPPQRPSEVTSHPAYQHPRPPPAIPMHPRTLPDDFFQHLSTGFSDERLREVAGRVSESTRYLMASHFGSNAILGHDENRPPQPPNPATNEFVPRRRSPPEPSTPKPAIVLTLSRATTDSIKALEDHKRECPACQLEFEPDNFMAVITCCHTAMHVSCLSAWVNSQTYSKSRTCMKCRRSIDARRTLNNVVPPVNEKAWDEGGSFDAPEHLKGDSRIELNVSARPSRPAYRRPRGGAHYTTFQPRGSAVALPATLTPETRRAITRARQDQMTELEEMRDRLRTAYNEQNRTREENINAQGRLLAAQAEANHGVPLDVVSLGRVCEEKKLARDRALENFQKIQREMNKMQNVHSERMNVLVGEALREQRRARVAEGEAARSLSSSADGGDAESTMSMSP